MVDILLRMLRGDPATPRLSPKEALALRLLVSGGEQYGLELVKASEGELKRGTVYVTLNRMEEKGLIESRLAHVEPWAGGPRKRLYRVTGEGARVLRAWERAAMALTAELGR